MDVRTEEEQSVQMHLGLLNYTKMPLSVCMRECSTMVPQWGVGSNPPLSALCTVKRGGGL